MRQQKMKCSRSRRLSAEKPPAEPASGSLAEFKMALGLDPEETYLELEVLQVMAEADYPTCVAFAFFWTGMIVTRENRHLFSAEDLQEWCAALTAYRKYDKGHREDPIILRLLTEGL